MERLRRVRVSVDTPKFIPYGMTHVGTSYWLSKDIKFEKMLIEDINNSNKMYMHYEVMLSDTDPLYVRTQYVYNDGSVSSMSRTTSLRGEFKDIQLSTTIVSTPFVDSEIRTNNKDAGEIYFITSDFEMYTGSGKHIATTWHFKDLYHNTLYKRDRVSDNLTELILPNKLSMDNSFYLEVTFHTDTDTDSNSGIFYNIVMGEEEDAISVSKVGKLYVGKDLWFLITPHTLTFIDYTLNVKNQYGTIIDTYVELVTLTPFVPTYSFVVGEMYYFEFIFNIGFGKTITITLSDNALDNDMGIDPEHPYINEYDFKQYVYTNGKTCQYITEHSYAGILLVHNDERIIYNYDYFNGSLVKGTLAAALPVDIDIDYPNTFIKELPNSDVVFVYITRDPDTLEEPSIYGKMVLNVGPYNAATKSLHFQKSVRLEDVYDGHQIEHSGLAVIKDNFLVMDYTYSAPRILLYNIKDLGIIADEIIELPMLQDTIGNVSLCETIDENRVLIIGGTDTRRVFNDTTKIVRTSDKVFVLDLITRNITELGLDILKNIPREIYSFHAVMRKDGVQVLFNNTHDTNYNIIDKQNSIRLYTHDISGVDSSFVPHVIVDDNDFAGDIPYLNTIRLYNGDILRISSNFKDPQKMYAYVSDTMALGDIDDDDTISRNPTELIVGDGEVASETNLHQYDKVTIEGSGKLAYVKKAKVIELDSTWLILTRDKIMTQRQFDIGNYSSVLCVGAQLVIEN